MGSNVLSKKIIRSEIGSWFGELRVGGRYRSVGRVWVRKEKEGMMGWGV